MPDRLPPNGLLEALHRVAAACATGHRMQINQALLDFDAIASPVFRPLIAALLRDRAVGGPDGMLADVEDIWNRVLLKVAQAGHGLLAETEAQAKAWLLEIMRNAVEDQARTARRRFWLLVDRLRDNGYQVRNPFRGRKPDGEFPGTGD